MQKNEDTVERLLEKWRAFQKMRTRLLPSEDAHDIDQRMSIVSKEVYQLFEVQRERADNNTTGELRAALKDQRRRTNHGEIRITVSDKEGEFVIMSQKLDKEIATLQLGDQNTYAPANKQQLDKKCKDLKQTWDWVCQMRNIPGNLRLQLTNNIHAAL